LVATLWSREKKERKIKQAWPTRQSRKGKKREEKRRREKVNKNKKGRWFSYVFVYYHFFLYQILSFLFFCLFVMIRIYNK
jgi:hypothetical protein